MVIDNIADYMNARSFRVFTRYEVSAIRGSIRREHEQKITRPEGTNGKTKQGRAIINERVVEIAKSVYGVKVLPDHVRLYKKCFADEYTDRSGKCAWGFKSVRQRLGYDPETGREVI